jgi:hypothetical protein
VFCCGWIEGVGGVVEGGGVGFLGKILFLLDISFIYFKDYYKRKQTHITNITNSQTVITNSCGL